MKKGVVLCITLGAIFAVCGCSGKPSVSVPNYKPERIAEKAIELFDTDGDGKIGGVELDACPGLKDALKRVDTDGDSMANAEEIAQRVRSWTQIGGLPVGCAITLNGQPVQYANVVFEPEPFLEDVISPATGETDVTGTCDLKSDALPYGAQGGMYRVRIISETQTIPPKYSSETTLGAEVSNEAPGIVQGRYRFDL